jgi:hypothetical protein
MHLSAYHSCDECGRIRESKDGWYLVALVVHLICEDPFKEAFTAGVLIFPWTDEAAKCPGAEDACCYDHALAIARRFRTKIEACNLDATTKERTPYELQTKT